jgi:hypothetical protein
VQLIARGGYNWTRRYPCRRTGSAFFFKQWGGVRKDKTGRTYRGQTFDEMPSALAVLWFFQMTSQQKITLGEMRASNVRGLLIYCADYQCPQSITAINGLTTSGCPILRTGSSARPAASVVRMSGRIFCLRGWGAVERLRRRHHIARFT